MYSPGTIREEAVREDQAGRTKVLLAASSARERLGLKAGIEALGYDVTPVPDLATLETLLKNRAFHLVLVVHERGAMDAIKVLERRPDAACGTRARYLLLSQVPRVEDAVEAMRLGAMDFICPPWDREVLEHAIKRAIETPLPAAREPASSGNPCAGASQPADAREIITRSPVMEKVLEQARSVAPSRAAVLIQGESGTGKELLARYIHRNSDRHKGRFVALNCAALPETLLESELFGHEKGAFSGAITRKPGKFEIAHNGTLLLDEITEMALPLQAKLLRVLQEGEVDRLGATSPVKVDVRIVATTNKDVRQSLRSGDFREDLYFRLNVIPLKLPPLRERGEDIKILAEHFLKKFSSDYGKKGLEFAEGVLEHLCSRPWKGNVRELKNVVERGVLLAREGRVTLEDLFVDELGAEESSAAAASSSPLGTEVFSLSDLEREMVKRALAKTGGNRTHAARLLGISVRTLRNKLAEYRQMGLIL